MELPPEHIVSDRVKLEIFKAALTQLACLGNGGLPGNSVGNTIALDALRRAGEPVFAASVNVKAPIPSMKNG